MAIYNTSGVMSNSTAATGCQVSLTGKAQWIYLSMHARGNCFFAKDTASTGTGTGIGLCIATGDTYVFQVQPGEAKYWFHVATAAESYYIMEVF